MGWLSDLDLIPLFAWMPQDIQVFLGLVIGFCVALAIWRAVTGG